MKTKSILLILAAAILMASCSMNDQNAKNNNLSVVGSGNMVSQTRSLSGFDSLEAGLHFDLTIHQGEDFKVVLFSDDNFIDYIQVEKLGTTLSFGLKDGYAYNISNVTLRAEVTMPDLAGLELNGSSQATLDGFKSTGDLQVELTGSSLLDGSMEADKSSFVLSSSTYLKLGGSAESLWVDACGNSVVDLSGYRAEEAALDVSCASETVVNVAGKLDVEASQNSRVFYIEDPGYGEINVYQHAFVGLKQ
ncbi:MAG: head GIN domain-containing protein [Anaerolineales bacterium]